MAPQIAVSAIVTWRWTGYNALIYLAGMQAIDYSLYEAAVVDGASLAAVPSRDAARSAARRSCSPSWCRRSAPPSCSASRCSIDRGKADGGNSGQYQTLGLLMYQQGWVNDRLGLASATAWTMFVIIVAAVLINLGFSRARRRRGVTSHDRGCGMTTSALAPSRSSRPGAWQLGHYVLLIIVTLDLDPPALLHDRHGVAHQRRDGRLDPAAAADGSIWGNLKKALELAPLNKGLFNSLIVSSCVTAGTVAFSTLAGFAFAKLSFRGATCCSAFCVATMMVPMQMGVIPLYMLMSRWGMTDHICARSSCRRWSPRSVSSSCGSTSPAPCRMS